MSAIDPGMRRAWDVGLHVLPFIPFKTITLKQALRSIRFRIVIIKPDNLVIFLVLVLAVLVANVIADIAYAVLDPRTRQTEA